MKERHCANVRMWDLRRAGRQRQRQSLEENEERLLVGVRLRSERNAALAASWVEREA